jgi:hypothetical protein
MGKELAIVDVKQDRLMGEQLTAQFERATGGMREVLIFAAMMMKLRESIVSARGHVATGGADSKDSGIKAWIAENAPKINRATAYRLESVGKSVAERWTGLSDSLAKKITFPALVTEPEQKLAKIDRRLPKKQKELFEYVQGTSQRSWLDQFRELRRGGNMYERNGTKGQRKRLTNAEKIELLALFCTNAATTLRTALDTSTFRFARTDADLELLIHLADDLATRARAWRKLTKKEREEICLDELAEHFKHL